MTAFKKGSFDNATSLCLKQLTQAMLLRKHISMPAKLEDLNLPPILIRFLKRNLISLIVKLETRTQETL